MDYAPGMRGRQPIGHSHANFDSFAPGDCPAPQPAAQGFAFQQLRHSEGDTLLGADVVQGQDIRMRQRRHGFGFALEAGQRLQVCGKPFG